jgi:hypothetical protein
MYPQTYMTAAFQRTALFKNIFQSSWYSIGPMSLICTENVIIIILTIYKHQCFSALDNKCHYFLIVINFYPRSAQL